MGGGFDLQVLLGLGALHLPDSYELRLGALAAGDDVVKHNGTDTTWVHKTGNLAFDNQAATGFYLFDLGTDTTATGFRIRNDSGTVLFEVLGDGSTIFAIDGTNDLSFVVNEDAAAGTDEDPSLHLKGGDGTEVLSTLLIQDSSMNQVWFQMQDATPTRRSPTVSVGRVGETTAGLDAFLRLEGATDAGANKSATITFLGHEDRLTITATDMRIADATATLALTAGALTETALVSADITPSGALTLRGGGASQFGDDTGYFAFDGSGALTTSGITTIELDGSGAITIESSAGAISVGADAIAQAINIGTGAAARVITIGNAASASLTLEGGVGAVLIDADTTVELNSSAGAISIGNDAVAQAVNIATGAAARVITIGNAASASLSLDAGVGALSLAADASSTWQVSGNDAGNLTLTIDAVNAGAGEGRLALSADNQVNINDGTLDLQMDAGVVTETGMVSIDLTPSGTMVLRGGGQSDFGDDTGFFRFDGSGALITSGVTSAALDTRVTTTDGVTSGTARVVGGRANSFTAAGAAHTNTTDETVLASYTIPANTLKAGSMIRVTWKNRVTVDNAGTTLTNRLRLGTTTLTGTEIVTTAAVDTSANHVCMGEVVINCREAPSADSALTAHGWYQDPGAVGSALKTASMDATDFATNGALVLELTGDWSAADANSELAEQFNVEIV